MSEKPFLDRSVLRGAATTLVLLILRDTPSYGYQLVQEIRRRSANMFAFGEGTIYPLLYSLEEDGSIAGRWKTALGGRRRKIYSLTPKGRKRLAAATAEWARFEKGMRLAFRGQGA